MRYERLVIATTGAIAATLGYATLRSAGVFAWECTVRYANPWQHAISCALLGSLPYVLVFTIAFLVVYRLARPHKQKP